MKFIFTADWHFSAYLNDRIIKESNLPERLHSLTKTINNIIKYCRDNKIQNLVVGGDVLHNKNVIYSSSLSILIDLLKNNSDINFILCDGNHDMSERTIDGISGLKSLDSIGNVHVIHEVEKIENILFIPWKYVTKEIMFKENSDYLLSHFGLDEGQLNSGISIRSDISMKNLSNFKFVLLGHYHKNQFLENQNTKLYYVGSPIQLDWGEKNEEKRFLNIDTETNIIESIPSSGYKKHYEFELNTENRKDVLEQIQTLKNDGHHIKLFKFDDLDTTEIEKDFEVISKKEKDITNRGLDSTMNSSEKINRFLEIKEIPVEKRERYRNVALEIMESIV